MLIVMQPRTSEDNIKKDMPDFPTSELIMYIRTNGITTKRKYN